MINTEFPLFYKFSRLIKPKSAKIKAKLTEQRQKGLKEDLTEVSRKRREADRPGQLNLCHAASAYRSRLRLAPIKPFLSIVIVVVVVVFFAHCLWFCFRFQVQHLPPAAVAAAADGNVFRLVAPPLYYVCWWRRKQSKQEREREKRGRLGEFLIEA